MHYQYNQRSFIAATTTLLIAMVDIPRPTLAFADGSRIQRGKVFTGNESLTEAGLYLHTTSRDSFLKQEGIYKELFLRELDRMLAEKGYDATAHQIFFHRFPADSISTMGSQSLLTLCNLNENRREIANTFGRNESTTSYVFGFSFTTIIAEGIRYSAPYFSIDYNAVKPLLARGVPPDQFSTWCKEFLHMAGMAEHDYLHQVVVNFLRHSHTVFYGFCEAAHNPDLKEQPPAPLTTNAEDHALALHAQIVRRLLEASPRRKEALLQWAVKAYTLLSDMQQAARQQETDCQEVDEAITYFAEIYAHRLFRVFSPDDAALHAAVNTGHQHCSIAQAMSRLSLATPQRLRDKRTPEMGGLEILTMHCEDRLGETYRKIHLIDSFPAMILNVSFKMFETSQNRAQITEVKDIGTLDIFSALNRQLAKQAHDDGAFNREVQRRGNAMWMVTKLRNQGKLREASKIEALLRKPELDVATLNGALAPQLESSGPLTRLWQQWVGKTEPSLTRDADRPQPPEPSGRRYL